MDQSIFEQCAVRQSGDQIMQGLIAGHIADFIAYPPRQKPGSFNLEAVMRKLQDAGGGANH